MTKQEAQKIFNAWQDFQEINDKLMIFFRFVGIPESFLPYPKEAIEKALNIIAKNYLDVGNKKSSRIIQETIPFLWLYKKDADIFSKMIGSKVHKDPAIADAILNNLRESRDSWLAFKENNS